MNVHYVCGPGAGSRWVGGDLDKPVFKYNDFIIAYYWQLISPYVSLYVLLWEASRLLIAGYTGDGESCHDINECKGSIIIL